jgi:hypothetical protein
MEHFNQLMLQFQQQRQQPPGPLMQGPMVSSGSHSGPSSGPSHMGRGGGMDGPAPSMAVGGPGPISASQSMYMGPQGMPGIHRPSSAPSMPGIYISVARHFIYNLSLSAPSPMLFALSPQVLI